VLTAALDVARLGARAPLGADFLRAAAPGYCTCRQQAEAPGNWFEQALAYATKKLHGAAAALAPAGADMGQVAGYTVTDYLIQHATQVRRYERLPASTWEAILSYVTDPGDTARLAASAESRLLSRCAIPLYRHAADVGDKNAAQRLAWLLATRDDLDALRARADTGDEHAAAMLAKLLAERGDREELRARADTGDEHAARRLAELLATRDGRERTSLIPLVDPDGILSSWLVDMYAKRGALDLLRARADAGDSYAALRLARLLKERGDLDELRTRADAGDWNAAERLADLLAERGDLDGAVQVVRAQTDAGDWNAASQLAGLMIKQGRAEEAKRLHRFGLNPDGSIAHE
jgi:hypothetical protein